MELRTFLFSKNEERLKKAFKIREEVFIKEQNVPENLEKDQFDSDAIHLVVEADGIPVATGRLFSDPDDSSVARIGRIATLKEYRGRGIAGKVVADLLDCALKKGFKKVIIHAQSDVEKMYSRFGFERCGKEFLEAGISHIEMVLNLEEWSRNEKGSLF
ncbi:MAG: GNAT family N-acetyltransferase [Candidatus Rifleibacteriota bacterium]